jgi:hypothetical protein
MLSIEIILLSLVHELRETDSALYNLKGVDGWQHVKEMALRNLREWESSLLGCAAISHVVLSHSYILSNTRFYQIHTHCAVCSPIIFTYTSQYTVLSTLQRMCCM